MAQFVQSVYFEGRRVRHSGARRLLRTFEGGRGQGGGQDFAILQGGDWLHAGQCRTTNWMHNTGTHFETFAIFGRATFLFKASCNVRGAKMIISTRKSNQIFFVVLEQILNFSWNLISTGEHSIAWIHIQFNGKAKIVGSMHNVFRTSAIK